MRSLPCEFRVELERSMHKWREALPEMDSILGGLGIVNVFGCFMSVLCETVRIVPSRHVILLYRYVAHPPMVSPWRSKGIMHGIMV